MPLYVTTPPTVVAPCFKVKVVGAVIVAGAIASLKFALILLLINTPVAVAAGFVDLTVGAVVSAAKALPPPLPYPAIKTTSSNVLNNEMSLALRLCVPCPRSAMVAVSFPLHRFHVLKHVL